jgi:flagellar protein FlgJ
MKIEGFGHINPTDTIKANKTQAEGAGFESALQKAFDEGDKKQLKEACNEFEAVMLKMLYSQMKATVPEGGLIEKSSATAMFEDMLDEELMDKGSLRGMGVSDMMYKQLSAKMDKTYKVQSEEKSPDTIKAPDGAEPSEK